MEPIMLPTEAQEPSTNALVSSIKAELALETDWESADKARKLQNLIIYEGLKGINVPTNLLIY